MRLSLVAAAALSATALGCHTAPSSAPDAGADAPATARRDGGADAKTAADAGDTADQDSGARAQPDSDVQRTDDSGELRAVSAGPAVGRRLTREEYFNSIDVVLGVTLDPKSFTLPQDPRAPHGFRNDAEAMLLTLDHVRAYAEVASAAAAAVDIEGLLQAHASCRQPLPECTQGFVRSLGMLLLRGELDSEEVAVLTQLFNVTDGDVEPFAAGARLVVSAMLQSPRFVYRLERQSLDSEQSAESGDSAADGAAPTRQITPLELATRLSFLVWSAAPDAELIELAEAGALDAQFDRQLQRLLDHPRARRALRQYVEQWLNLDSIPENVQLAEEMKEETYRLFEYLLWEREADFMSVFTAQRAEISGALARFYGLASERGDDEVAVYDLSIFPYRSGFLSQASVIMAHTINPAASMIDRGLFVLHDIFCDSVPPPSGDALRSAIEENKVPESSELSQRERFAMQRENPLCAGCHGRFDPLGEAFEVFDALGQHVTQDAYGNPLYDRGHVTLWDVDTEYESFEQYAAALGGSERVARCMAQKSVQHAFGRALGAGDRAVVDDVYAGFVAGGRSYRALLSEIAHHPSFRRIEVAP